jgi:uncharacterized membrane protein YeiB
MNSFKVNPEITPANTSSGRIAGFDLARAYAIFGMFIVNFNTVFGSHLNHKGLSGFLNLFNGNSSMLFVMLAGMGLSLMSGKPTYKTEEKKSLRWKITRRSLFLFCFGLLFFLLWPADILHFYEGYMHIAALLLFARRIYLLTSAAAAILIFHVLLFIVPYETGWNFVNFQYADFWTLKGFLRNTFYNGWNAIFPWVAYFLIGMYLGRLDWDIRKTRKRMLYTGLVLFSITGLVQAAAPHFIKDELLLLYLTADYLPPFLPFMLGTASFGMILISLLIPIGKRASGTKLVAILVKTGRMTFTHYISHLFFGLILLSLLTGKNPGLETIGKDPEDPWLILAFQWAIS